MIHNLFFGLVILVSLALIATESFTLRKIMFRLTFCLPARWRLGVLGCISLGNPRDRTNVLRHTLCPASLLVEFLQKATGSPRGALEVLGDGNTTGLVVMVLLEAFGDRKSTLDFLERALGSQKAAQRMYESSIVSPDYSDFIRDLGKLTCSQPTS